jgi:hypothetical protein
VSLPFGARYTVWMAEVVLPGGNTVGAVLIGDVVHKRASAWTPTVHALLRYLQDTGFEGAPRALGFDEQGREMLTYLRGEAIGDRPAWPAWVYAESTLVQVGRWLRRLHDLTAEFTPPVGERWFTGTTMRPGWVVGHQDAAPYNAAMNGDRLVGFFDWDTASPSSREIDLAFSALLWVPLTAPAPDRRLNSADIADRSRRFHLFLDAYEYEYDRGRFSDVVPQRAQRQAAVIRAMDEAGDPVGTALLHIAGHLELSATHVRELPGDFWNPERVQAPCEHDSLPRGD